VPTPSSRSGSAPAAATTAVSPEPPSSAAPLLSIFGGAARIDGKFDLAGSLQVDCQVSGELRVGNRLVVGPLGTVSADVRTVDIVVMGRYEGSLVATGSVEIMAGGHVTGQIKTDSLIIEKGSFFQATVSRLEDRPSRSVPAPLYRPDEEHEALRA
jgi:cytoskeletal protein CcmA (bactofilin family)